MVVVRIKCGLGNQMFQYAFGHRLAKDLGVPLKLDISSFVNESRPYVLKYLRIEAEALSGAEATKLKPKFPRLRHQLPWINRCFPSPINIIREKQFCFDTAVLNSPAYCYLEGDWQTEKYFAPLSDSIRRQFQLATPMTIARRSTANLIKGNVDIPVSVHVRRGDYVSHARHGTCAPDWYASTMGIIAKKVENPCFFIFSDDPCWSRDNLPRHWPTHFVEPLTDKRDFEDMHLMALCRHHIIANSSFSWWGAWLNPSPDKHVIAPVKWFANSLHDTRDIVPKNWMRM